MNDSAFTRKIRTYTDRRLLFRAAHVRRLLARTPHRRLRRHLPHKGGGVFRASAFVNIDVSASLTRRVTMCGSADLFAGAPVHALASFDPFFCTLRTASAIWSMSDRGPSSIVCVSHTATSQSWSLAGQCVFSRYSDRRSRP